VLKHVGGAVPPQIHMIRVVDLHDPDKSVAVAVLCSSRSSWICCCVNQ
jgi:hypothetical protein